VRIIRQTQLQLELLSLRDLFPPASGVELYPQPQDAAGALYCSMIPAPPKTRVQFELQYILALGRSIYQFGIRGM